MSCMWDTYFFDLAPPQAWNVSHSIFFFCTSCVTFTSQVRAKHPGFWEWLCVKTCRITVYLLGHPVTRIMRSKILSLDGPYNPSLGRADWDWNIHALLSASPLLCQLCLKTAGTDPWQRGFAPALLSGVCLAPYLNRVPSYESKHYLASSLLRLRPSGRCPCWLRLAAAVWCWDHIDQTNFLTAIVTNS